MKRILLIAYTTYAHDGRVKRHAEALAERGDQVDVICLADGAGTNGYGVNLIGLRIPRYRGASRSGYLGSYVRFFARAALVAARLSLKQRYDLVMVCTMPDAAVLCALMPKLLGSKVVLDVHDTMPEIYLEKFGGRRGALGARLLMLEERSSAWLADRVLAVHRLHDLRLQQAGIAADKIRVVMNVPDPRLFAQQSNGRANGEPFVMVCHGTVTRRLGVDVAFAALKQVLPHIPGAHLRIIGGGDFLPEARRLVEELGLQQAVTFEDLVPIERLPGLLEHAAVGLVPNHASSATHLMLPVKLLEYAMLGIPIIAARLRTIEYYFSEEAVRYFRPDDAADLAQAILELYRAPQVGQRLACRARQVIDTLGAIRQREQYYLAIDSLLTGQEG